MRCCSRSSLVAASALLLASSVTATERVLVVGAQPELLHDAVDATTFTPAGLAQLAMDAFGLPTGKLVRLATDSAASVEQIAVQTPVHADLFTRVDAYAMIFVDNSDAAILDAVDVAAKSGYHKQFDVKEASVASTKIPAVLARELKQSIGGADIQCAGTDTVCHGDVLAAHEVSTAQVDAIFAANSFLDRAVSADAAFAKQLAQTQQITNGVAKTKAPNALYVASFSGTSSLSADKQAKARQVLAQQIQSLLDAVQKAFPRTSGAQVVAAPSASALSVSAIDSIVAYSRMLLSFNDQLSGSDDDDDDDDDHKVTAVNGTTSDVSLQDIAEYQIVLWTSVLLGAVLLLVIMAMCNMDTKRDSLLYAKFITSSANRKFD